MHKRYSAIAIANLIIKIASEYSRTVTNLQLQKILYFLQAYFLIETNEPLINSKFSRWPYGPVIKEVYHIFSSYGASAINVTDMKDNILLANLEIEEINSNIFGKHEINVKKFIIKLIDKVPWELVELTHEQSIWKQYESEILRYEAPDYSNAEIVLEFKNNTEYQIWKN